ncbi:MAG: hypothetical protein AB8F78_12360 [Saprospiraceae bacterium]
MPLLRTYFIALCFGVSLLGMTNLCHAQDGAQRYQFKAGQVLDIILLSNQPAPDSTLKVYFQQAFPIAQRLGYSPMPGVGISRPALLGNYQPESLIFGSWTSLPARLQALDSLEAGVPRFHEMRREIWSTFNMTYWELTEPLDFTIEKSKYNVVSAYWSDDAKQLLAFTEQHQAIQQASGAQQVLQLVDGSSPFMYRYAPDLLIITAWPDEASYQRAQAKLLRLNPDVIDQVHEFAIR